MVIGPEAAAEKKKYMESAILETSLHETLPHAGQVAYFSMEIAIQPSMPTYSGGLGVLAGDTLRSAADLGVPLAAFTLVHRKGYFEQHLSATGVQSEDVQPWNPADFCTEEAARVTVADRRPRGHGARVALRPEGAFGHVVPIYLLDTDLDENSGWDRGLTDHLYGGDTNYRLQQEIVLGDGRRAHGPCAGPARERLPHERRPRGAADAGAAGKPTGRRAAERGRPTRTSSRCGAGACSRRTRRCRRGTTDSRPSRRFAFWAATGRRAWKSWDASATDC